jgi:hypothetical protein
MGSSTSSSSCLCLFFDPEEEAAAGRGLSEELLLESLNCGSIGMLGSSMLCLGSSARNSNFLLTDLFTAGATDERRLLGEEPMCVLKGDLADGGGNDVFVLRNNLRVESSCVGSGMEAIDLLAMIF